MSPRSRPESHYLSGLREAGRLDRVRLQTLVLRQHGRHHSGTATALQSKRCNSEFRHVYVHTLKLSARILGGARGLNSGWPGLFGGNPPALNSSAPALGVSISLLVATGTETTAAAESPFTPQSCSLTNGSISLFRFLLSLNSEHSCSLTEQKWLSESGQLGSTSHMLGL